MKGMLINDRYTSGEVMERIVVINPAPEEVLGKMPRGTAEDVNAAVAALKAAFDGWRRT